MIRRIVPLFLFLVLLPGFVFAAQFKSGDSVTIPESETVKDDLYIGAGSITVNGTVEGDLIIGGGNIDVKGTVNGDVIVGGGTITLRGKVLDDVRVAGGQINIEGQISDDLLGSGGMISLNEGGSVGGDIKVAGGDFIVAGTTGNIEAAVGNLTIKNSAIVNGNVRYWSEEDAKIDSAAKITGTIQKQAVTDDSDYFGTINPFLATLIGIIVTAFFAWLLSFVFPNKTEAILSSSAKHVGANLLWGFLTLVGIPGLAILLFITVIGIPAGMLLLLAFPLVIALGWLVSILMAGYTVNQILNKQPAATWIYALAGAAILTLIGIIPLLGWIITSLFFLAGLGSLVRFDWQLYNKLRRNKEI